MPRFAFIIKARKEAFGPLMGIFYKLHKSWVFIKMKPDAESGRVRTYRG